MNIVFFLFFFKSDSLFSDFKKWVEVQRNTYTRKLFSLAALGYMYQMCVIRKLYAITLMEPLNVCSCTNNAIKGQTQ